MGAVRQVLDVLQPRSFLRSLGRGSWILLRLIGRALVTGLKRAVSSTQGAAKTDPKAADGETAQDGGENAGRPPSKEKAAAAVRSTGEAAERLGMGLLVVFVAAGTLSGLGGMALLLLRPYVNVIAAVLVLGWIAAALTADLAAQPGNDHDESAGEQPEEDEEEAAEKTQEKPAGESWEVVRDRLTRYVEQRVAAGAAGHTEGVRGRGARVDDLLAEQQANGGLPGMERKDMIELLEEAGITVREQMSFTVMEETETGEVKRKRNMPGVHVEDLAKDLGRTPQLPPHLVPDLTPTPAVKSAPIPAQELPQIPAARAAGE
ncbi:hypothetical protein [Streptomyces sp. NBC_00425]|uniref:hypothetical protein n=1 Tax=Streptomyces sp. NBC_00425 TaxID=2975740 RepID=UPI002E246DBB